MNNYFYRGKFFDKETDFMKFVDEWPDLPFDMEDFKTQMEVEIETMEANSLFREKSGEKFTNRDAYRLLRLITDWSVRKDGL